MGDLISRQAAIDAFHPDHDTDWYTPWIIETLNEIPSAQQWIPCSERLPEKDGRYLVTNDGWGEWIVDWNAWLNGQWLYNSEPIAWMSLPEPYKGEEG